MALTASDLAKACGVSRSTVNRALLGEGRINKDTKEMILKKAKELGYKPNLLARSLAMGKSMTIGVIVADINNQYFAGIIDAIGKRVKQENYFLTITFHEKDKQTEKELIEKLVSFQTSGLILSPINKGKEFEDYLSSLPIPTVIIGNDMKKTTAVGIDEYQATVDAVNYIIDKGYQNIIFCCPPLIDDDGKYNLGHVLRMRGYKNAMKKHGLKSRCIEGDDYLEEVKQKMKNAVNKPAFLCSGDIFANEIMTALHQEGYIIKRDFGVMGFDYVKVYQNGIINMTTVDNHIDLIGQKAADILLEMMNGERSRREYYHEWVGYDIRSGNTI